MTQKSTTHYEILSARKYYGKHATGSVLLVNGSIEFHGTTKEVKSLYKKQLNSDDK